MALHPFVQAFLDECKQIAADQRFRREQKQQLQEMQRLALEGQQAKEAGDLKKARACLRQADKVRAAMEASRKARASPPRKNQRRS